MNPKMGSLTECFGYTYKRELSQMDPCSVSTLSSAGVNFSTSISWSQPVALIEETEASREPSSLLPGTCSFRFWWLQCGLRVRSVGSSTHITHSWGTFSKSSPLWVFASSPKKGGDDNNATLLMSLFNGPHVAAAQTHGRMSSQLGTWCFQKHPCPLGNNPGMREAYLASTSWFHSSLLRLGWLSTDVFSIFKNWNHSITQKGISKSLMGNLWTILTSGHPRGEHRGSCSSRYPGFQWHLPPAKSRARRCGSPPSPEPSLESPRASTAPSDDTLSAS